MINVFFSPLIIFWNLSFLFLLSCLNIQYNFSIFFCLLTSSLDLTSSNLRREMPDLFPWFYYHKKWTYIVIILLPIKRNEPVWLSTKISECLWIKDLWFFVDRNTWVENQGRALLFMDFFIRILLSLQCWIFLYQVLESETHLIALAVVHLFTSFISGFHLRKAQSTLRLIICQSRFPCHGEPHLWTRLQTKTRSLMSNVRYRFSYHVSTPHCR